MMQNGLMAVLKDSYKIMQIKLKTEKQFHRIESSQTITLEGLVDEETEEYLKNISFSEVQSFDLAEMS